MVGLAFGFARALFPLYGHAHGWAGKGLDVPGPMLQYLFAQEPGPVQFVVETGSPRGVCGAVAQDQELEVRCLLEGQAAEARVPDALTSDESRTPDV